MITIAFLISYLFMSAIGTGSHVSFKEFLHAIAKRYEASFNL